jgi:flagella basal body P-ring formation protein FlgA
MRRTICLALLLLLPAAINAQPRATIDSLVERVTHDWGTPPADGWQVQWTIVRGDSAALRAASAQVAGSRRSGVYTVTMRRTPFAAPTLVARLAIGHTLSEIVAARAMSRNTTLNDGDLRQQDRVVWGAPSPDTTARGLTSTGGQTRRAVREGEVIRSADLVPTPVMRAGDLITAEFIHNGVRLALAGTALQNAALGGRVAVRLDRGRRFAATVIGPNTVRID